MRAILDEGVPEALANFLYGEEVSTVKQQGWRGIKNGRLLDLIEAAGFDAFLTNDKRLEREQHLSRRGFATLILSITNWNIIRERISDIQSALDKAQSGEICSIDCGTFVPRRFRNPGPPR